MVGIKGMAGYSVGLLSKQPQTMWKISESLNWHRSNPLNTNTDLKQGKAQRFAWQAQTLDGELTEVVYDLHGEEEETQSEDSKQALT